MFPMFPFIIFPPAPDDYNLPPTLYSIMNSIVNYDKEEDEQTKIKDLAAAARSEIFDFNYTLTNKISKEDFECMILNHFIMRRIGYDTMTAFKIALNVKLNSIMPMYNKMFEMLDGWDLFNDGEVVTRIATDTGSSTDTGNNSLNNTTTSNNTSDRRYSDAPQDRLEDVRDGSYVSDYNFDTENGTVTSNSTGSDSRTTNENRTTNETIERTPSDKIKIYKEFMESKTSIYEMIFKDLDVLFYGLV